VFVSDKELIHGKKGFNAVAIKSIRIGENGQDHGHGFGYVGRAAYLVNSLDFELEGLGKRGGR
jgi:hypothetical protein